MSILERLRKPKQQEVLPTPQPQPSETPQKVEKEYYPDTTLGVLRRVKDLAKRGVSEQEVDSGSSKASAMLLEICREEVAEMKRMQEQRGGKWEGKVVFGSGGDQDGSYWSDNDGVEIGDYMLTRFHEGYHEVGNVREDSSLQVNVNPDLTEVFSANYVRIKNFSGRHVVVESTAVTFENNHITGISLVDTPPVVKELGSFYEEPKGLAAELSVKFSKL